MALHYSNSRTNHFRDYQLHGDKSNILYYELPWQSGQGVPILFPKVPRQLHGSRYSKSGCEGDALDLLTGAGLVPRQLPLCNIVIFHNQATVEVSEKQVPTYSVARKRDKRRLLKGVRAG